MTGSRDLSVSGPSDIPSTASDILKLKFPILRKAGFFARNFPLLLVTLTSPSCLRTDRHYVAKYSN